MRWIDATGVRATFEDALLYFRETTDVEMMEKCRLVIETTTMWMCPYHGVSNASKSIEFRVSS